MRPTRRLVFVEPQKSGEKAVGGIVIPDSVKDRGSLGEGGIVDTGPDAGHHAPLGITGFDIGSIVKYHANVMPRAATMTGRSM